MASGAFEPKRGTLPATDTEGDERALAAGFAKLVEGGEDEAGTGGSDRVAEGDGATAAVKFFQRHFARQRRENREHLGGEGFVDLDEVCLVQRTSAASDGVDRAE